MSSDWTAERIPDQSGRLAIVTGANSGIGLEAAKQLARHGAEVVLAVRNAQKGDEALRQIRAFAPGATVSQSALDLADLDSVRAFAARVRDERERIDLLINNAGVMVPPKRAAAGPFELQFATNHLGHFALTGLLLDRVEPTAGRVVTVSSTAHRLGRINFDDLQSERKYSRWRAYGQSKLANLLFTFELDRRLRAAGSQVRATAAHPGYSNTHLQTAVAGGADRALMRITNPLFAQDAAAGALPTLFAAVADVPGGSFAGPDGFAEQRGKPKLVKARPAAHDEQVAARLWSVSEQLTGVTFDLPAHAATA
ncbi:oxidoreductase [Conexibacter sp. JD483]|uniref:oxidoreductase n=1 Tax=unclassified Conexibacter TaxID=2627773 RepID=UPI00272361AB|nr:MULTISPECIES: oxidoreductase [unclassified Conexibacter]MDO8186253.1 oxidoreductase [Conexibacter sp. CPCC 205706]MDO8199680.1 oxidoreductase [Conexibacter sp. CPCC 205762]MDR9372490.1 oxidoreductase [Conexibacter sp. JD483]